ncbi:aminotransferase class I/II-fold pyridoxal phosphate-dependent enzyme [Listeria grandensis]|uniref:DegT/DnrJ/EryC1/StrS family aminotransferase n=1 Tax=Listeria grandensis TaxID=1494963 RepID=UPI00162AC60C|nr:aminotransferase class I/II-fold pyridoxal phosphate-dependent enzyme [Listeria grandensis]MBC1475779.1 aminotransferase class I/II-fold pyridoxal phosphate-dependent enzyme [Listeria grandensis]
MLKTKKMIPLAVPHMSGMEEKYIQKAFQENWIAPLGSNVDEFEASIASYNHVSESAVVSSGTAAIHLALQLLGVGAGDTVFCSTFTFVASINPALYLGAKPVFIDSEQATWCMSPFALKTALEDARKKNQLPKAIIVVHIYGQSAKMDEIIALAKEYGVPVVEDAAESLGGTYRNAPLGTLGDFGIFSFNGNKIITTSGGGALVAKQPEKIAEARFLASQSKEDAPYYLHHQVGYNYRLSNVLAGIGIAQMDVLNDRVAKKQEIFATYEKGLADVPSVVMMPELDVAKGNRWLSTMTFCVDEVGKTPEDVMELLKARGIDSRLLWKPMHQQPLFQDALFYADEAGDVATKLYETGLCLPSSTQMTQEEQEYVIDTVKEILIK